MAAIKFYVGTGYVALSSCDAYITCAGKAHTNCKFFPERPNKVVVQTLIVIPLCNVTASHEYQSWEYDGSKWVKDIKWGWSGYRGWHAAGIPFYEDSDYNQVIKLTVENMRIDGKPANPPESRFFMIGYVPRAMRPEEEWGPEESAWIHRMLKYLYGRED